MIKSVAWIVGSPKLEEHILNGVARGLYHREVADRVIELIRKETLEVFQQLKESA